jgi:hypothetical protein
MTSRPLGKGCEGFCYGITRALVVKSTTMGGICQKRLKIL